MHKLKVTTVGSSTGVVLPKEVLAHLKVRKGDTLCLTETPEGYVLSPQDPAFEEEITAARRVMRIYNGPGTAEQWIEEGKLALRWTRLSCRAFRDNAVRLQLFARAYNLATLLRTLALPDAVARWSLTTVREKLVMIGARIMHHGRYVVFQLAGVAAPRALFAVILRRIDRPRGPPLPAT